jgi:hypothetical protein
MVTHVHVTIGTLQLVNIELTAFFLQNKSRTGSAKKRSRIESMEWISGELALHASDQYLKKRKRRGNSLPYGRTVYTTEHYVPVVKPSSIMCLWLRRAEQSALWVDCIHNRALCACCKNH